MQAQRKSAVAVARRIHLFPCRTQKLSFFAPKVVGGKLPARIGRCRAKQESDGSLALFVLPGKAKLEPKFGSLSNLTDDCQGV